MQVYLFGDNNKNIYILGWESYENYLLQCKPFNIKLYKKDITFEYNSLEIMSTKILSDLVLYDKSGFLPCVRDSGCTSCRCKRTCSFYNLSKDFLQYPVNLITPKLERTHSLQDSTQSVTKIDAF